MDLYLYLDRNTFLHRLDPRSKMGLLFSLFVLAFIFDDPAYAAGVLGFVFVVVSFAKAWTNVRRMLPLLSLIAVVTVVLFALTSPGSTTLFWIVKVEGIQYGITVALRLVALIVSGLVFLSITTNEEVSIGLVKVGIPYRFSFSVSTALRLVPTILGTASTIVQAQRSRGHDIDSGNVFARMKKFAPIVIPVVISTLRMTQVFAMALESKGFGAERQRTYLLEPRFSHRDVLTWIGLTIILAACITARLMGYGALAGR
ncbi:MAG: cobalt transport protein [Aeromicrobium sp.]|nr:cobalt transport protein [Aeromicrobium sp.]